VNLQLSRSSISNVKSHRGCDRCSGSDGERSVLTSAYPVRHKDSWHFMIFSPAFRPRVIVSNENVAVERNGCREYTQRYAVGVSTPGIIEALSSSRYDSHLPRNHRTDMAHPTLSELVENSDTVVQVHASIQSVSTLRCAAGFNLNPRNPPSSMFVLLKSGSVFFSEDRRAFSSCAFFSCSRETYLRGPAARSTTRRFYGL
jgi:hypothetical protein